MLSCDSIGELCGVGDNPSISVSGGRPASDDNMNTKRAPPAPAHGAPPPKRLQIDAAGRGVEAFAQRAPTSSPVKRQLRRSMLVLFFVSVAQVKEERRNKNNARPGRVIHEESSTRKAPEDDAFQRGIMKAFDNVLQNHLNPIYRSLQHLTKQTGTLSERIGTLSHEVGQIKKLISNRDANERYRSEAKQENAAVTEEVNQEQTALRFAANEVHEGQGVELRFLNKLKDHLVYTNDKITSDDGTAIKIAIFRDNQIVTAGQLSSARIEILVLHDKFYDAAPDKWTECDFDAHIVSSSKGAVLGGVLRVKLTNGKASLSDVFFNMPSSKTGSKKLILAARVLSSDKAGLQIKEAVMNQPVEVQVNRNKSNKKSDHPKLKDEVHRLKGISGKGNRAKWLKDNGIHTVADFKKALNKDEEKIYTECFNMKKDNMLWKATVQHAEQCDLEGNCKLKSYGVEEKHVILFFNCVHDLVGATFRGRYVAKDNFNSDEQDEVNCLKIQAYNELDNIVFDHEMKDNFPVPLSSTLNTSIGDDASIRFTDTTGLNPPDLHVTSQVQDAAAVQTAHHATFAHANQLPQTFLNNNNACGFIIGSEQISFDPSFFNGYQGTMRQISRGSSQFDMTAIGYCIAQPSEALPVRAETTGGNNLSGLMNLDENVSDDSLDALALFGGWVPMASVGTSTGEQKVFVEMSSRNEHGKGFRSQEPGCLVSHVMCEPPAPHVYKQRLREMIHRPIIEGKDREKGEKLI
uniref:Calmodulin-binding protein n=1 Tax=Oryza meridionalis TaxID=40149 RepID=A0A0E0F8G2_9ORYZ